ncbi:ABC transporter substrate-binding protein [Bradyrhizobium sp.]|jgi:NitT/TauT family transport system substrate-binding protein|uniref:ABC transporter substrate-binding protein n=1 Tax=Bradyrhizobium sp. TaxID=376 RepID=UPI002C8BCD59|nr:ABC transporter substrate-binding protein [Bradyrhizobium sp.]HWX62853.1 ABC transporter substrate-binding protein [Bradyrhizobium sp.]
MPMMQTRREFLTALSLAGAAGLLPAPVSQAAEGALETTTVRFLTPGLCVAPVHIAEALLRAEGFTDIRYDDASDIGAIAPVAHGEVDFAPIYASQSVRAIDAGERVTLLAGVMVGCFELFAREGIGSIAELKGKSIGVQTAGSLSQQLVTLMAAQVGLDPVKDIHWITDPSIKPIELFVQAKIDAFLGFPPAPQDLRARRIGHVIVNTGVDRPWSQYFCCMIAGNPDYVRAYPTATKRVLRAILKATDLCATEPARVARQLVDGGFTPRYDYAQQTLSDNPYKWREYDAEDTIRWYALRLHEVGLIKSSPQKIIADGTDWRFLNEVKRELKA